MAYTNEGQIEKYLAVDIDNSISTQITTWISAVTEWINRYCGKSFETASSTKYYDTDGTNETIVDSFVGTPTEVSVLNSDGTTDKTLTEGHANDYLAYPLNPSEKNRIVLTTNGTRTKFPTGARRLKITASFGFSASVPADVQLVATKLVGEILREGIKGGKLTQVTLGDYQASFATVDEKAEALGIYKVLDAYRDLDI